MLLALDIGNSSITLGLMELSSHTPRVTYRAKLAADLHRSADEYAIILRSLLTAEGHTPEGITAVMLGSVVPQLTHTVKKAVEAITSAPIRTVGSGVKTGILLKVDDPAQLGADIVTNATAAVNLCGAPVIFVDIGTATVIGAVSPAKALVGVAIAPGPTASLEGLQSRAALIPYTELTTPDRALGKNTTDALRAGLITGTACMLDGMIARIREEQQLPADTPVIATGGLAQLVLPACRTPIRCEPDLTLLGLAYIHMATERARHKSL